MPEPLAPNDYLPLVMAALAEDIGGGDATTLALVPEDSIATAVMTAREPLVMAGVDLALAAFEQVDGRVEFDIEVLDGQRDLFSAERNYLKERYDYVLELLQLEALVGDLQASDVSRVNNWLD